MDLQHLETHLRDGLPADEQKRLRDATVNLDYYRGHFDPHKRSLKQADPNNRDDVSIERYTLAMRFFADQLSGHLYRANPTRSIPDNPEATTFLQRCYSYNKMFAKWQAAHRFTFVSDCVAFQVAGTSDPQNPVKIHVWRSDQFFVATDPDDPTEVQAVITIDRTSDCRKRYRLWTATTVQTYETERDGELTKKLLMTATAVNPYRVIPFSFVHNQYPAMEFWSGGPGNTLRMTNEYMNLRLCDTAESIVYGTNPILQAVGVSADYKMPRIRPGLCLTLPSQLDDSGMPVNDRPELIYSSPDLGFIETSWTDLQNYMTMTLTTLGIPEAAFNFRTSAARSGVSIVAEQGPLVMLARGYQPYYREYEADLAKVVCQVAVAHAANNGTALPALSKALDDFNLTVQYGEMFSELPGSEQDRSNQWMLENGLTSKHQVLMRRNGWTYEEADEHLEHVAEDIVREQEIFGDLLPSMAQPPAPAPPGTPEEGDAQIEEGDQGDENNEGEQE